jgi:hypothetical protein
MEIDLIATYEEVHCIPNRECITGYFGDLSLHHILDNVPEKLVAKRLDEALNDISLTRTQFNAIALEQQFYYRANIRKYIMQNSNARKELI